MTHHLPVTVHVGRVVYTQRSKININNYVFVSLLCTIASMFDVIHIDKEIEYFLVTSITYSKTRIEN